MKYDLDIWDTVQTHSWKWQSGRVDVVGVIVHATRSGYPGRPASLEYQSAVNWFKSPFNAVLDSVGNKWYGGMSNYIIGGGQVCRAVPEDLVPRFSAGIHDFRAISIEMGQGTNSDPYYDRDIELLQEAIYDLSMRYGFKTDRIPFVDANNSGWPGIVGHEDTAQGKGQGKSDPGPLLWQALGELDMSPEEVEKIARRVFDEATPLYFLDLMKKYFTEVAVGDFSDAPDPDVIASITAEVAKRMPPLPPGTEFKGKVI